MEPSSPDGHVRDLEGLWEESLAARLDELLEACLDRQVVALIDGSNSLGFE
jgi:hypothetical protein